MKTVLVNTSCAEDNLCCFLPPREGIGAFFSLLLQHAVCISLPLWWVSFSAFSLWSEDTGVLLVACLEVSECRTALLLLSSWQPMLGVGRGMLGIDKPCVIWGVAVTNLCVSSILIMKSDYSFPSSVSSAPF